MFYFLWQTENQPQLAKEHFIGCLLLLIVKSVLWPVVCLVYAFRVKRIV